MDKKSVSASLLVLYLTLFFSVIGFCFSVFVFKDTKIEVKEVKIVTAQSIEVFEDEELSKKVSELKLSNMELGLKPATGEVNKETQIPSTITDTGTSEGYYSTVHVKAVAGFRVEITDIIIKTTKDQVAADEQKKNIFVAIKNVENAVKSLEKETTLATFSNVTELQKLTFYIWIGAFATDELEGAKISFNLEFKSL